MSFACRGLVYAGGGKGKGKGKDGVHDNCREKAVGFPWDVDSVDWFAEQCDDVAVTVRRAERGGEGRGEGGCLAARLGLDEGREALALPRRARNRYVYGFAAATNIHQECRQ